MKADGSEQVLMEKIGYSFADVSLLREALTHKSFSNEQLKRPVPHNERLEFLGDAVLDMVVSHRVFLAYPAFAEGELTRVRAEVVSEDGLAKIGESLALGGYLHLGRGEERSGGRTKKSLIANALEAVLGAVYCDGGAPAVEGVVGRLFAPAIAVAARRKAGVDYKTRLQELVQSRYGHPPHYELVCAEGPDHRREYTISVRIGDRAVGSGSGRTKKAAAQAAAQVALARLEG